MLDFVRAMSRRAKITRKRSCALCAQARAMVLVFSEAANNSDEIKKELSLASRYHVPVLALRIEDVEPSDAFAYELSTRQWIDAFAAGTGRSTARRPYRQNAGIRESGPVPERPQPAAPARRSRPLAAMVAAVAAAALWSLRQRAGGCFARLPPRHIA